MLGIPTKSSFWSLEAFGSDMIMKSLSRIWLSVTPWTVAHQAPLSMGFFRQEYWSELPFPQSNFMWLEYKRIWTRDFCLLFADVSTAPVCLAHSMEADVGLMNDKWVLKITGSVWHFDLLEKLVKNSSSFYPHLTAFSVLQECWNSLRRKLIWVCMAKIVCCQNYNPYLVKHW